MRFFTVNLGCKVNQVELEKISDDLVNLGYHFTDELDTADFAIINTCTVTQKADAKSLKSIRKLQSRDNLQRVFATGCFTQLEKGLAAKLQEKTIIVEQSQKNTLADIVEKEMRKAFHYDSYQLDHENKWQAFKQSRLFAGNLKNQQSRFLQHTRAFVKVQDGCNAFCSYCRIPFARGAPVSRATDELLRHIVVLDRQKVPEIVLTGINMSMYRHKNPDGSIVDFSQMLQMVLDHCRYSFIRLSSIEPHNLDDRFFNCLKHPRLVPHLHLPLQACNDRILSKMGRRYDLQKYYDLIERIYEIDPHFSVSTDVITGYPDESEREFEEGIDFLKRCKFSSLHVFPFSFRPFSKDFEQKENFVDAIDDFTRLWRADQLRRVGLFLKKNYLKSLMGRKMRLVVEEVSPKLCEGQEKSSEQQWLVGGISEYYIRGSFLVFLPSANFPNGIRKGENLEVVLVEGDQSANKSDNTNQVDAVFKPLSLVQSATPILEV